MLEGNVCDSVSCVDVRPPGFVGVDNLLTLRVDVIDVWLATNISSYPFETGSVD